MRLKRSKVMKQLSLPAPFLRNPLEQWNPISRRPRSASCFRATDSPPIVIHPKPVGPQFFYCTGS
jgi:hypothetical protein